MHWPKVLTRRYKRLVHLIASNGPTIAAVTPFIPGVGPGLTAGVLATTVAARALDQGQSPLQVAAATAATLQTQKA